MNDYGRSGGGTKGELSSSVRPSVRPFVRPSVGRSVGRRATAGPPGLAGIMVGDGDIWPSEQLDFRSLDGGTNGRITSTARPECSDTFPITGPAKLAVRRKQDALN